MQFGDGRRIPHVVLAVAPPMVEAADVQAQVAGYDQVGVGERVSRPGFLFDLGDANTANARGSPREILIYEILVQSDRLEYLRAAVALDGGYAHLGHYLDDAFVGGFYIVLLGGFVVHVGHEIVLPNHIFHRLEDEVWVDGARAVANKQREMSYVARLA